MRVNTLKHCMFWYSMILMVKFQCNINSCTILLFKVHLFCKNSVSIRFPNLWYVSLLKCKLPQHDVKMNLLHSKPASVFQSKSGSDCSSTVNFFLLNIQILTSSSQMQTGERRHDFSITCALPIQRRGAGATAITVT